MFGFTDTDDYVTDYTLRTGYTNEKILRVTGDGLDELKKMLGVDSIHDIVMEATT